MTNNTLKKIGSKYELNGKNGVIALELLDNIADVFDKFGVRYWLDFGTLLGIVRENRILPWDTDMDISIMDADQDKVAEFVLPELKRRGYRTYTRHYKEDDETLPKGRVRAFRARNNRLKFLRGFVKIDIFVMYEKDKFLYWYELGAKHKVPIDTLQSFDTINFNGRDYSKPKDHDAHLTYHYGDWRVPNKEFDSRVDNFRTLSDPQIK